MCIQTLSRHPIDPKLVIERLKEDELEERKRQHKYMGILRDVVR